MELKTTTVLLFCISSFLLLHLLPASAGPAGVALRDILGHNITLDDVYYIRNYTFNSHVGVGIKLFPVRRGASSESEEDLDLSPVGRRRRRRRTTTSFVGFDSSESNAGLAVSLVPAGDATVIFPGDRFKLVLADTNTELKLVQRRGWGAYVVTGGRRCTTNYFSVTEDDYGIYSLMSCGSCAACKNACVKIGLTSYSVFYTGGTDFNIFFEKKVEKESSDLVQSQ